MRIANNNQMKSMASKSAHKASGGVLHILREKFSHFALLTSHATGHPVAFLLAMLIVVIWALTGPVFGYSDTWQLVINTGTTIVTFLMVFLIQNTQNRDTLALQLKLSELVLAQKGARNSFADLESLNEEELEEMHADMCKRAEHTLATLEGRRAAKRNPKNNIRRAHGK
jgi:low affinity Fe/Cu permease